MEMLFHVQTYMYTLAGTKHSANVEVMSTRKGMMKYACIRLGMLARWLRSIELYVSMSLSFSTWKTWAIQQDALRMCRNKRTSSKVSAFLTGHCCQWDHMILMMSLLKREGTISRSSTWLDTALVSDNCLIKPKPKCATTQWIYL